MQNDTIAVLDLKQNINRRTKRIEFTVNYKDTHTNINVKESSNHPDMMKRGIIKGFADRARALCDEHNLQSELQNIEDVFVANGYRREVVRGYMEPRGRTRSAKRKKRRRIGVLL